MSLRSQSWYPYVTAAAWGLLVLVLVLVNSGNVFLAVGLGVLVGGLSWRIDRARGNAEG